MWAVAFVGVLADRFLEHHGAPLRLPSRKFGFEL
jgi:hypothetical protein